MKLTSDEKLLTQRSHYEVNTIENKKKKTKKNFTGFYTEDDPKLAKSERFFKICESKEYPLASSYELAFFK